MKLVIKLDDETYKQVINRTEFDTLSLGIILIEAVQKGTPLEKIIDKIDFEERWLINIKMENGFISIADIESAMTEIRSVIFELKEGD